MLFSCDNIHMHFGARPVLQGISLGVHASEVLGIVGPNGAGKTTLLEILSGRTKPTQGRVLFEGQDVTAMPLHQRARRGLARTYQSPVVPEQLSVEQVLKTEPPQAAVGVFADAQTQGLVDGRTCGRFAGRGGGRDRQHLALLGAANGRGHHFG
jgi:ABC-type branched-subunit amino acid transport system ATPase component